MRERAIDVCGSAHRHAVQFYGDSRRFFRGVADFLYEGVLAGQAAIAITTAPHRKAIEDRLSDRGLDCEQARRDGALWFFDAPTTLSRFLVSGEPNTALFERDVAALLADIEAVHGPGVIRAYGEMVNLLWQQGRCEAALHLESLWNRPPFGGRFDLLCGYPLQGLQEKPTRLQDICDVHTAVVRADDNIMVFNKHRRRTRS